MAFAIERRKVVIVAVVIILLMVIADIQLYFET
jgi:hypothetical protein